MLEKLKKKLIKIDRHLYKIFGTEKKLYFLENLKEAKIIFSYLNQNEKISTVKFVGGCVRKALNDEPIDDIDLATSLEPKQVKEKLHNKDIEIIDTGISHGTLTLIINKKKFEITTLRKDVLTDGRYAKVQFTKNWEEDAQRRDFTINAIYADINGEIFDPLDGISDLQNGQIRFIGSAEERINEDYLRILRYFRFFIQYSKSDHDENIIQSIKKNINGINKISNERIFDELKKILKLGDFYKLFSNDITREIILSIFNQFKFYERLKIMNKLDQNYKKKYKYDLILGLLIIDQSNNYEYFCHKFKTSNEIKDKFEYISKNYLELRNKKFFSKENIKKCIYFSNKNNVKDLLLFSMCLSNKVKISDIEELIYFVDECKIPKFPISGDFLKKYGYESGERLGKKLKLLEEEWIKNNFVLDKKNLEKSLEKSTKTKHI